MSCKIFYWSPRVLATLAILFMMLFSMDCFEGSYALKEQLICFLMHNIPAGIVIVALIVAWKWELAGGILFLLAALAGSIIFKAFSGNSGVLIVLMPFVLTGILFILHSVLFEKEHPKT